MARKDLAGLAALGALGMMMSKGKKAPDVDTSGVSDMDLTGGARSMTPDTGEIRAEDGTLSKLRRNTETGDLYSPNEPITRPTAKPMVRPRPRPVSADNVSDMDLTGGARSPDQTGGQIARIKNLAAVSGVPIRPRQRVDEAGNIYKKGGKVASSASRRADGIATKGKTRGRMI